MKGTATRRAAGDQRAQPDQPDQREHGSATVWALAAMAVVCLAGVVVLAGGLVAVDRIRAGTVADLAALAAAGDAAGAANGTAAACAAASRVAAAQHAELVGCRVGQEGAAVVELLVPPSGPLAGFPAIRVSARAGPQGAS
jgi:secretion/DNA translocation related TadE-like protein